MAKDEFIEESSEGTATDMLGTGLVLVTTLVLIVAFILIEMGLGDLYGAGLFGK
jgi:hypothetical protein